MYTPYRADEGSHLFPVVAIDCEMVGIRDRRQKKGVRNALARVSIVDSHMRVILDEYVKPEEKVIDYRTKITGITQSKLEREGLNERMIRGRVQKVLKNKVVVGHALYNDFSVLKFSVPQSLIRDTALSRLLREEPKLHPARGPCVSNGRNTAYGPKPYAPNNTVAISRNTEIVRSFSLHSGPVSLKKLVLLWFNDANFQDGVHDSVADARMALKLYCCVAFQWERELAARIPDEPYACRSPGGSFSPYDANGFEPDCEKKVNRALHYPIHMGAAQKKFQSTDTVAAKTVFDRSESNNAVTYASVVTRVKDSPSKITKLKLLVSNKDSGTTSNKSVVASSDAQSTQKKRNTKLNKSGKSGEDGQLKLRAPKKAGMKNSTDNMTLKAKKSPKNIASSPARFNCYTKEEKSDISSPSSSYSDSPHSEYTETINFQNLSSSIAPSAGAPSHKEHKMRSPFRQPSKVKNSKREKN